MPKGVKKHVEGQHVPHTNVGEYAKAKKATVVSYFRDKNDFSVEYKVGADVSHFDKDRIAYCIEKGLVKADDK